MHRLSEIAILQTSNRESTVTITLRTPQLAKALRNGSRGTALLIWATGTVLLVLLAWQGGFGSTAHGYIRLTIAIAILFWLVDTGDRLWQAHNRVTHNVMAVHLTDRSLRINQPHRPVLQINRGRDEIRFASRPHPLGRQEERNERRVGYPVGYEYRDAWEVWCEAGLDVHPIAEVAHEDDARAIVRHLTAENLFVTRDTDEADIFPERAEPA